MMPVTLTTERLVLNQPTLDADRSWHATLLATNNRRPQPGWPIP